MQVFMLRKRKEGLVIMSLYLQLSTLRRMTGEHEEVFRSITDQKPRAIPVVRIFDCLFPTWTLRQQSLLDLEVSSSQPHEEHYYKELGCLVYGRCV